MTNLFFLALLVSATCSPAVANDGIHITSTAAPHDDRFPALNALFNNSYFAIPSITLNLSTSLTVTLSELQCGNLYVDKLGTNATSVHYALDVAGTSMDCHGRWDYVLDGQPYHPGTFRADVSGVNVQLTADGHLDSKYHLPGNFTVSVCDFKSKVMTSFKGHVVAWILDLLRPLADGALENVLHTELCKIAEPVVTHLVNNITNIATAVLGPFLDNPSTPVVPTPAPSPPPAPGTVVNWSDVPVLSAVIAALNAIGPDGMSFLFKLITTGSGSLNNLPLGNLTLRSSSAIANTSLVLQHLSIGGLDTFTSFDVLDPERTKDNSTIDTKIGLSNLTIVVTAELQFWRGSALTPSAAPAAAASPRVAAGDSTASSAASTLPA